jgi:DNA-binding transcriptional LysR family regulator
MLDLAPLRYFQSAYETGTFSAAARLNEVRQPSVSAAIARLEAHYGGPLFQRGPAGLVPTDLGHELYEQCGVVLSQLQQMEDRLKKRMRPQLRVHCCPDVLMEPFQYGFQRLSREKDGMVFQFTDTPQLADVVLCSEACTPQGMGFVGLWDEGYGVALPVGHPLSLRAELTLQDLAQLQMISRPYCPSADLFRAAGEGRLMVSAQALHDAQLLELVAAGLGVALVPLTYAQVSDRIAICALREAANVTRRVGIAHRKTSVAASAAKTLAEVLS